MSKQPSNMKDGTRVWICDHCKKQGTWKPKEGWHYLPDIVSEVNTTSDGGVLPVAFCSEPCADVWLKQAVDALPKFEVKK